MSNWLVSSAMELRITSRLHQATGWSATGGSAADWSSLIVKFGIRSSLDGGVMFDARLYADVIRRSHARGSASLLINLLIRDISF